MAGDYGCLYSSWMVLHCLEDSVRDPRADFLVTPSMSAASSPPTTSRTSCWSPRWSAPSRRWRPTGAGPWRCRKSPSLPTSRELLLLGDLSSLRGQEEQLARAAPLLSVPGSSHCSSIHPTPSCSPGGAPLLPPAPDHEADRQEAPELPPGRGQAGEEDGETVMRVMTVPMT